MSYQISKEQDNKKTKCQKYSKIKQKNHIFKINISDIFWMSNANSGFLYYYYDKRIYKNNPLKTREYIKNNGSLASSNRLQIL